MLTVLGVVIMAATFLLIEGSLVYYHLPSAPRWLKDDKSLQAALSSSFVIGLVGGIFIVGQSLVDLKNHHVGLLETVLVVMTAAGFVVAWRWLRRVEQRLGMTSGMVAERDASHGFSLTPESVPPEDPQRAHAGGKPKGRKAA